MINKTGMMSNNTDGVCDGNPLTRQSDSRDGEHNSPTSAVCGQGLTSYGQKRNWESTACGSVCVR